MEVFKIIDAADQQFGAVLNRRRVTMRLRYNPSLDRWSFDLSIDDLPVLHGRRIVRGVDLVKPYDFGIGILFASESGSIPHMPTRNALISGQVELWHISEEEVADYVATISP